jgi:DNA-binding IclR family transcriptional regulator
MRTVERAFSIFECFSLQGPSLTLQEIANQIGLAKSTTSRLVGTLERLGYFTRASDLKYSLKTRTYTHGKWSDGYHTRVTAAFRSLLAP